MRRTWPRIVVAAVLGLTLVSCSTNGSDGSAEEKTTTTTGAAPTTTEAAPSVSRAAYSEQIGSELFEPIGQDDRCLSGRLVDALGVDRLNEAGVSAEQVTTPLVFTLVKPTDADRKALERATIEAIGRCGTSEAVLLPYMQAGYEGVDMAPFLPCASSNLTPRLAALIVGTWDGSTGSFEDAAYEAITLSTEECPDLQVAMAADIAHQAGYDLSPAEQDCFRDRFTQQAAKHEVMSDDDWSAILDACG